MIKLKIQILTFLCLNFLNAISQNEFSKWYFGNSTGLDFNTNPITVLSPSVSFGTSEGCATISDNNGNFLFYTEGTGVVTKNYSVMQNGTGMLGDQSSTQSAIIVQKPNSSNLFYIFTTQGGGYHSYNIVDITLAAGYGSVTVKNYTLYYNTSEKQVAVRHCNGKDIWIISHERNTNNFRSYLLTANGVNNNPIISSIGDVINGFALLGHLKISSDGKKLAMACAGTSTNSSLSQGGVHLFDFDASTGVVSNSIIIKPGIPAYGVEFSSDGSKLYATTQIYSGTSTAVPQLFQWSICNTNSISSSEYSISFPGQTVGSIQRAINNKLYIAQLTTGTNTNSNQFLHVINSPNNVGASMGFSMNAQSVAPGISTNGLPNFINSYIKPIPAPFTSSLSCQSASFTVPPIPSFSSGCSSTPYAPSGYLWDFGEGSSGAANNSTLTNPSHTYANTGTYSVSLILFNNCTNDTLKQIVNVSTPGPNPQVAGTFTICKGDKQTYTVSGGSSYLWFNNVSTNTISLSPSTNTVYSVRSSSNGCNVSKFFSVTVNPCLGISQNANSIDFRVFPNPVNDILTVSTDVSGTLSIYDNTGRLIHRSNAESGQNLINTKDLSPGIYIVELKNEQLKCYGRIFKI